MKFVLNRLSPAIWLTFLLLFLFTACVEERLKGGATPQDINPPMPPDYFWGLVYDDSIEIHWEMGTVQESRFNSDIAGALIVRGKEQEPQAVPYFGQRYHIGDQLGYGQVIFSGPGDTATDSDVQVGVTYYYEIFAYDDVLNYADSKLFEATPGSLIEPRLSHVQILMPNQTVFIAGGIGGHGPLNSGEIFYPQQQAFSRLTTTLNESRFGFSATLLQDGRILLAGGYEEGFTKTLDSAEIFDPSDKTFTQIKSKMNFGRAMHSATLLDDGRVFFAGGISDANVLSSCEMFDPMLEEFVLTEKSLAHPRYSHSANLIDANLEEVVLIAGGLDGFESLSSAQLFHPTSLIFTDGFGVEGAEISMIKGRASHTASLLSSGQVLLAGGYIGSMDIGDVTETAEIYDPELGGFLQSSPMYSARSGHSSIVLDDGTVLIVAGISHNFEILNQMERFDPIANQFNAAGSLKFARTVLGASLLPDGTVLITGGNTSSDIFSPLAVSAAEIYDPIVSSSIVVGAK